MKRALLCLALTLGCPRVEQPVRAPNVERAPIVVAIVVDALSAWVASERWPTLPKDGGFARLLREGTYLRESRYAHAVTDTAPGHAAIFTGVTPRENGITLNERVLDGKLVGFLRDDTTKLVDAGGVTTAIGSSIAPLRVPTVADRLRKSQPRATIVSLSLKDRGAIFGGGRHPTATLWFDVSLDRFVTSTAFASSLPAWAAPHTVTPALVSLRAPPWELLDRKYVESHAHGLDGEEGEGDWEGLGKTFPHVVARAAKPAVAFRATPSADRAVLALADAAIRNRDPKEPMLLSLSLSANDYITHVFGPDSFEAWDQLRRLDEALAKLFATLDAAVSADGWSLVLTGDHGGPSIPELLHDRAWCTGKDRWNRPCGPATRLYVHELSKQLEDAAVAELGPGHWIDGVADPLVFYTAAARALEPERRKRLDKLIMDRVRAEPGIAEVHLVRTLPAVCPTHADESVAALVCRSVSPDGPGDVYVVTKPGSFFDTRYAVGKGQNHGTPWLFDRTVPIVIRAPGRIAAGVIGDAPTSFETATRALESLLGVPRPPSCCGLDLVSEKR